jgi:hypothetical protein
MSGSGIDGGVWSNGSCPEPAAELVTGAGLLAHGINSRQPLR